MIYALGGSKLYTDNYMIERYDIEKNYWVTLHVLLEFEFNFLHHKALFNAEQYSYGMDTGNIHILNVQRVEDAVEEYYDMLIEIEDYSHIYLKMPKKLDASKY